MILVRPNLAEAYVSSVSYGGIPVGNDATGTGKIGAPFLTCEQAEKSMALAAPSRIIFNGNPATPPTYIVTRTIDKALTLAGIAAGAARIAANNASVIMTIDPLAGQSVTLQDIILDASLGTPAARCIDLASEATAYTLNLTRCTFQNWTTYGVKNVAANFKGSINVEDCSFSGGSVSGCINVDSVAAGSLNFTGENSFTITNQQTSDVGCVFHWVSAAASGVSSSIAGTFDFDVTVDPALATVRVHYGALAAGCLNTWMLDGAGEQRMTHAGVRQLDVLGFTRGVGAISNGIIDGANVVYDCPNAGLALFTSTDSIFGNKTGADSLTLSNFIINDLQGGSHGAFHCWSTNSKFQNGTINGPALAIVDKENDSCLIDNVMVSGGGSASYLNKGSTNSLFKNSTVTLDAASADGIRAEDNSDTGTVATGTVQNVNVIMDGWDGGGWLVNVEAGSSLTFTGNDWHHTSGTLPSQKWAYGSFYTTFAAWQAAHGPTDTSNIP